MIDVKKILLTVFAIPLSALLTFIILGTMSYLFVFFPIIFVMYSLFEGSDSQLIASLLFAVSPLIFVPTMELFDEYLDYIMCSAILQIFGFIFLIGIYVRFFAPMV